MSEEQLKAFLEKAKNDTSLQEKLKAASTPEAAAAIAQEAGFTIAAADFQAAIDDAALEGAAGGGGFLTFAIGGACATGVLNFNANCGNNG